MMSLVGDSADSSIALVDVWSAYLQRVPFSFAAILAFKQRIFLRKQAAALEIQKSVRCYFALKSYSELRCSAITLQTGLRAFGAYMEYVHKKKEKSSISIQVDY